MLALTGKPQCTVVHEDFQIKYGAKDSLFSRLSKTPFRTRIVNRRETRTGHLRERNAAISDTHRPPPARCAQ